MRWWQGIAMVLVAAVMADAGFASSGGLVRPEPHRFQVSPVAAVPTPLLAESTARRVLRRPRLRERNSLLARHGADVGDGPGGYWLSVCVHRRHPRFAAVYVHTAIAGFEGSVYERSRRGAWRQIAGGSDWGGGPVLQALLNWSDAPCGREPLRTIGRRSCGTLVIEPYTDHAMRSMRVTRLKCDEARSRMLAWAQGGYVGDPEGLRCRALALVNFMGNVLTRCTSGHGSVEFYRG